MDNHCNGVSGGMLPVLKTRIKETYDELDRLQVLNQEKEDEIKKETEELEFIDQDKKSLINKEKLLTTEYVSIKGRLENVLEKLSETEGKWNSSEKCRKELKEGDEFRAERIYALEIQRKELIDTSEYTREKIADGLRRLRLMEDAIQRIEIRECGEEKKMLLLTEEINLLKDRIEEVTIHGTKRFQINEDAERTTQEMINRIKIAQRQKEEADQMSLRYQMQADRSASDMMKYQMKIQRLNNLLHAKPSESLRHYKR